MAYTPTVYTSDASSPDLDATNLNKSENGIKDAHLIAVPVDCTSRVAEYTGDGGGATVKDRAGNGYNLTATNITYVNGKYGKEMSFNGTTSKAQAAAAIVGTTGTIAVRFKRNAIGTSQAIFSNITNANTNGMLLYFGADNICQLRIAGATAQNIIISTITDMTSYHTLVARIGASSVTTSLDGGAGVTTAITVTPVASSTALTLGVIGASSSSYLSGIISHFRYDSRTWTDDEVRAWDINTISIDSRV